MLSNTTDVSFGAVVQFGCASGFSLNGTSITICQNNGLWSTSVPMCVRNQLVQCPEIPTVDHMTASSSNRSAGAMVNLTCDKGYQLDGQKTIYCAENGVWSSPFPKCTGTSTTSSIPYYYFCVVQLSVCVFILTRRNFMLNSQNYMPECCPDLLLCIYKLKS